MRVHEYFQAINTVHKLSIKSIVADPGAALQKLDQMHQAIRLMDQAWVGDTLPELEVIGDPVKRLKAYERIAKYDAPRKLREIAIRADRAKHKAFRDEIRGLIRQLLGPIPEQLATAKQQLRCEIKAEFERRENEAISIDEVALAVHARLRPEVQISLGYIRNMAHAIARRRWGNFRPHAQH